MAKFGNVMSLAQVQELRGKTGAGGSRNELPKDEYVAYLRSIGPKQWGDIDADDKTEQRVVKRSITIAAKAIGKVPLYKTYKALKQDGKHRVVFELVDPKIAAIKVGKGKSRQSA